MFISCFRTNICVLLTSNNNFVIVQTNMIHTFSCKNFYSFNKKTFVSFVVNDKAPDNDGYFRATSGLRLSKVESVIGPNASGKTNLLKVLPFLKWLIVDSLKKPSKSLPVRPFVFDKGSNNPIELSVDFEIDGSIFTYSFALTSSRILSEELKVRNKSKKKITSKKLFSRSWNDKVGKYEFDGIGFSLPKGFENLLPATGSIIAYLSGLKSHKQSQIIVDYWEKIETNVIEAGWIGDHSLPNGSMIYLETLNFYSDNQVLKKKAEELLRRFDLGLEGFEIKKEQHPQGLQLSISGVHSFEDHKQYLPFSYESSGTRQLFVLLKTILQVLSSGGVAILDEIDVNLHPDMIMFLFDLFIHPDTNPNNAQLLFSTHSHIVLSKLDKYEINLVEKNENGESETWRLDKMSGVRSDDNYFTKYMAGAYGATPDIN